MTFCRGLRSRRWTRKQKRMQEQAMAEARAAGWQPYQEGEDSSVEGGEGEYCYEYDLQGPDDHEDDHTASNSWSHSNNKNSSYDCPTDEEGGTSTSIQGDQVEESGGGACGVHWGVQFDPATSTGTTCSGAVQESAPPPSSPSRTNNNNNDHRNSSRTGSAHVRFSSPCDDDVQVVEPQAPTPKKSNNKHNSNNKGSRSSKPVNIQVKSFSSMQMFTPDYFEKKQKDGSGVHAITPRTAETANISSSSDDEEDESLHTATEGDDDDDDNTALDNAEHLDQVLNDLLQTQPVSPPASALSSPYHASPQRGGHSDVSPRLERDQGEEQDQAQQQQQSVILSIALSEDSITESTAEVTWTETTTGEPSEHNNNNSNNTFTEESTTSVIPAVTVETIPESDGLTEDDDGDRKKTHESSDDDSDDSQDEDHDDNNYNDAADADDDSLDLGGVSTSVWPSQSPQQAAHRISTLSRGIFSPSELLASAAAEETDGAESLDEDAHNDYFDDDNDDDNSLEMPPPTHEGSDVFLATEGARYGNGNSSNNTNRNNAYRPGTAPMRNDLFQFQEAPGGSPEGHRPSGSTGDKNTSLMMFVPEGGTGHNPYDEDGGDLDFQPRYHEDPSNEDDNNNSNRKNEMQVVAAQQGEAVEDAAADDKEATTPANSSKIGGSCFGGIHFVSPKLFQQGDDDDDDTDAAADAEQEANNADRTTPQRTSLMSPLSSMVHPMNLKLFGRSDSLVSVSSMEDSESLADVSISSCPVERSPTSVFLSDKHSFAIAGSSESKNRRSNLSSSFRSSTKCNRVAYRLNAGKKSMSRKERVYSKSFLPGQPLLRSTDIPTLSPGASTTKIRHNDHSLSILLVEMTQKIFEIVSVDIQRETTVGDVLAKARAVATDPALSEQKYVSISYASQDFGAPMLPVSLLIDWEKHRTRPLAVAVPTGHSASEMQAVKRVLSKNPRIQRWWKQQDPFRPKTKEEKAAAAAVEKAAPPPVVEYDVGKSASKEAQTMDVHEEHTRIEI